MAKRRDNMLEAFRQSEESEQPTAEMLTPLGGPIEGASEGTGGAGEPFLPPEADPFAAQEMREEDAFVSVATRGGALPQPDIVVPEMPDGGVHLPMGREAFVVLQVLALAIVFLLGRLTAGTVVSAQREDPGMALQDEQAAGSMAAGGARFQDDAYADSGYADGGYVEQEEAAEPPAAAPVGLPEGLTAAEEAFLDPRNRTTILAITLRDTADHEHLAWASYDLLTQRGFPAIQPRRKNDDLVVLVGAAPTMKEMDGILEQVRKTVGPDGKLSYASAYRVNIEDFR